MALVEAAKIREVVESMGLGTPTPGAWEGATVPLRFADRGPLELRLYPARLHAGPLHERTALRLLPAGVLTTTEHHLVPDGALPWPAVLRATVPGSTPEPGSGARHARALGALLARVHADPRPFGDLADGRGFRPSVGGWRDSLWARCADALTRCRSGGLDPGPAADALLAQVRDLPADDPPRCALVHGAFGPAAFRVGADGSVALTDWAWARWDDPLVDLARVALLPDEVRDAFLDGYGAGALPLGTPRMTVHLAGVAFEHLASACDPELTGSPGARTARVAHFRALAAALSSGGPVPRRVPVGAVRGERLLARLATLPTPDPEVLARWCVAASAVDVDGPVPGFDALVARWTAGPARPAVGPPFDEALHLLLADPWAGGDDLRLVFAAAYARVARRVGGAGEAADHAAGSALPTLAPRSEPPGTPATTLLFGTLARGAVEVLRRHRPDLLPELDAAAAALDAALHAALEALSLVGWRLAGLSLDPAPLLDGVPGPLGHWGPLVADALRNGATAVPVEALLRTLGAEPPTPSESSTHPGGIG